MPLDRIAEPREAVRTGERLVASDRDRLVRRAVDSLPSRYREAVILLYFMEMNVAAAAESLQVPEGTLKARLSRARDLLRRKLPRDAAVPRLTEG